MGLADDIKKAFVTSMGADNEDVELSELQDKQLSKQSELLSKAIIDFLQKQEFTITQLKASVVLEDLKTAAPLNVKVTTPPGQSVLVAGSAGATTSPVNGVVTDSLNLSNNGSTQGGRLDATGYAWIGNNKAPDHDTEQGKNDINDNTLVKLLEIKPGTE